MITDSNKAFNLRSELKTGLINGKPEKLTTVMGAWFGIMCCMAGSGILGLPFTLMQGGWIMVPIIVLVGYINNYTGKILIKCLYPEGEYGERLADYPSIGRYAFGKIGAMVVNIFHYATLLGVSTLFLILAAKFLLEGIGGSGEGLFRHMGTEADTKKWTEIWTVVAGGLVCIPILTIRTMGETTGLAFFGILTSGLCVVVVIIFAIMLYPVQDHVHEYDIPAITGQNITAVTYNFAVIDGLPTAFSATALSFGGHNVMPTIEKHMREPNRFNKSFNAAYITLLAIYLSISCTGYYVFGEYTYSPILCNLPNGTTALGIINAITKLLIAAHVMLAYPMLMTVLCTELEDGIKVYRDDRSPCTSVIVRSIVRLLLVALTVLIAAKMPYFPDFMSLIGALCLTMCQFVLPVLFYWKISGKSMPVYEKIGCVFIVIIGCVGGGIGTVQSIQSIYAKLVAGKVE